MQPHAPTRISWARGLNFSSLTCKLYSDDQRAPPERRVFLQAVIFAKEGRTIRHGTLGLSLMMIIISCKTGAIPRLLMMERRAGDLPWKVPAQTFGVTETCFPKILPWVHALLRQQLSTARRRHPEKERRTWHGRSKDEAPRSIVIRTNEAWDMQTHNLGTKKTAST